MKKRREKERECGGDERHFCSAYNKMSLFITMWIIFEKKLLISFFQEATESARTIRAGIHEMRNKRVKLKTTDFFCCCKFLVSEMIIS